MEQIIVNCETGQTESVAAPDRPAIPAPAEWANRDAIIDSARQALATNRTYVALAAPTNAQIAAQVKALTQQNIRLIRLALGQFEDVG